MICTRGAYSTKFVYEAVPPRVPIPYPYIYNTFYRKGTPFVYFLLKWYPFHTPSLEICITDLRIHLLRLEKSLPFHLPKP